MGSLNAGMEVASRGTFVVPVAPPLPVSESDCRSGGRRRKLPATSVRSDGFTGRRIFNLFGSGYAGLGV